MMFTGTSTKRPFRADIELTRSCNQHCIHCMVDADSDRAGGCEMTLEQITEILEILARQGFLIVQMTGGEPFLRSDLVEILGVAKRLGYCILLSTNGTLLNRELARALVECNVHVEISLDGSTPEVHDHIRGTDGAFRALMRSLALLSNAGANFSLGTVLLKQNTHQASDIADLAADLGASALSFRLPRLIGRAYRSRDAICASRIELKEALDKLQEKIAHLPQRLKVVLPGIPHNGYKPEAGPAFGCAAGTGKIGIAADGSILPCLLLRYPIGKPAADGLARAISHPIVQSISRMQVGGNPQCRGCPHRPNCRGGCPAASLAAGRGIQGRDPICDMYFKET